MLNIPSVLASDSYPLLLLWSHFGDILLVGGWVWLCELLQPVEHRRGDTWYILLSRVFFSSLPFTLAGVWGDAGVIMPFNWGGWDATHIWRAAALKGVLSQVSLGEEWILVVESS